MGFRLLLAPIMIFLAWHFQTGAGLYIVLLMYLGLISDILDGIVARKMNVSGEKMRRLDGVVDLLFWLSVGASAWLIYPGIISELTTLMAMVFIMEALCYLVSIVKFGKEASAHAFLSKMWGLSLLLMFTNLIGFGNAGATFYFSAILGMLSQLDVIMITFLLPRWQHDVPSSYHAYLIRKGRSFKRNKYLNG